MESWWISRVGCKAGRRARTALMLALPVSLAACVMPADTALATSSSAEPPPMRWDHRPEAADWTRAALTAVAGRDEVLAGQVPADIAAWCPGYETASLPDRRAFWVGLMSALARHESTWNPAAVGGGGKWFGLMQISPRTARGHGCAAQSGGALKDGASNLTCAVEIFAEDVARDGVVAGPATAASAATGRRSANPQSGPTWPPGPAPSPIAPRAEAQPPRRRMAISPRSRLRPGAARMRSSCARAWACRPAS